MSRLLPSLLAVALAGIAMSPTAAAADRITGQPFATRSEVYAPHAMAATSHPLATQIAPSGAKDAPLKAIFLA